jgi:hypothetical protein
MRFLKLLTVFPFLLACSHAVSAAELHVHPRGDDSNPGTSAKPLRTFDGARAVVRKIADKKEPVRVLFAAGIYYTTPVVFEAADSGTAAAPVIYQAATGAEVVISGGSLLQLDWTPFKDGIFKARVPEGFITDQLFVNGRRMHLARYPNFDAKAKYFGGIATDAFSKERAARWADPRGGFIHAMHKHLWGDFHYVITGKDATGGVTFEGGWQNNRRLGMHDKIRFVENIFEELDAPGEWFLDTKNRTLYFYPPKDVDLKAAVVEAVQHRTLVEFRGDQKDPVTHLRLQGFVFRHSTRTFMDTKEPLLRSDWTIYRGGAIFFQGAEDCAVEDCTLEQLGGNAIFVSNYNRRIVLRGCHIDQAGANSVAFVGDPAAVRSPLFEYGQKLSVDKLDLEPGPKTSNYPADCLVENCLLVANGRFEKQTAGVQIAMAMRIKVRHCSIYDCPRAGINIGDGCWGGHIIEYCDVFDTVKETGDHGSFNSWGRDRYWVSNIEEVNERVAKNMALPLLDTVEPIILRNNRWRCDHGWDIDLDDGSSNYRIENNLCLKGGIKFREGFLRWLLNNILFNNSFHPHVWFRDSQDEVLRNICSTGYRPIGMPKVWGKEVDFNLFVDANGLKQAQGLGLDVHSAAGDPQFINPAQGDFRVKEGSPALKLGFKNFAMDQFGVVNPRLKALARTPKIDVRKSDTPGSKRDPAEVDWLGARIQNVVGMGEMSALGLPSEAGVVIVTAPPGSAAAKAGLRARDVIVKLDGKEVSERGEFLRRYEAAAAGSTLSLVIVRDQNEQTLSIQRGAEKRN